MPSPPSMPQGMASPAAGWEQGRDARAAEGSPLQPPNPPVAQEEPLVSSAPGGYVLMCFLSASTRSLASALEAVFTAWLIRCTKALKLPQVGKLLI